MPYRVSGRPRAPESPNIDENLLRKPWSSRALVVSLVYAPLLTWWLVMSATGTGARELTPGTKVAVGAAFALWLVVLLILRARHERFVRAAVATMQEEMAESARLRVDDPLAAREGDAVEVDDEDEDESEEQGQAPRRR